jgi:hypothetical protein
LWHEKIAISGPRFVKAFGLDVDGVWFYPRPEVVAGIGS